MMTTEHDKEHDKQPSLYILHASVKQMFQEAAKKYEERRQRRLRIALRICYGLLAIDLLVLLTAWLKWI